MKERINNNQPTTELFTKACAECGEVFETESRFVKLCDNCRRRNEKESSERQRNAYKKQISKPKINTYNALPVEKFVKLVDRYNRRYGTRFSYGQIMLKLQNGQILQNEFYI